LVSIGPDQIGSWTSPFEEGGARTPRCAEGAGGRIVCKPVGYAQAITPDGRVFYLNGQEGTENIRYVSALEYAPELRNSRARVLDLRRGTPTWTIPSPEDGGGRNPNIRPGDDCRTSDPLGTAGVPGRPGDGFVGSTLGSIGVEHDPTCSPDTGVDSGDLYCTDLVNLADGRTLLVGGSHWYNEPGAGFDRAHGWPQDVGLVEVEGLRNATLWDPTHNTFLRAAPMKYGRWYPGAVTLPDGKVLTTSGVTKMIKSTQLSAVRRTETYDPATNAWTENYTGPASENSLPLIPRLVLAPNGKVFYQPVGSMLAPGGEAVDEALFAMQQFFDPRTGQWEMAGPNPIGARSDAATVPLPMSPPYDRMTLLTFGGTLGPWPSGVVAVPLAQLTTIDREGRVTNSMTGSLRHPRWFPAGVALPDGKVLALNGGDRNHVNMPGGEFPVRTPELYNPASGTWTDMAPAGRDRTYHQAAILLPDGRVLAGGDSPIPSGFGQHRDLVPGVSANADRDPSFEILSPPYLFYGPRPRISHAPAGLAWGETTTIGVDDAAAVRSVVLMRTPSQQHVMDSDTRTLNLAFTVTGPRTLRITVPPNGVVAPPGTYYLFVNRQNPKGLTPSVARILLVGANHDSAEAIQPFPDDFAGIVGGSATDPMDTGQNTHLGAIGRPADRAIAGMARPLLD
jgi:hypothetical protein